MAWEGYWSRYGKCNDFNENGLFGSWSAAGYVVGLFNSVLPQAIFSSYSTKKRGSCRADACEVHCRDARSLQRDFQPRTKTQGRNRGPANWFPKRRLRAGY